jgi:hypothetical protein
MRAGILERKAAMPRRPLFAMLLQRMNSDHHENGDAAHGIDAAIAGRQVRLRLLLS